MALVDLMRSSCKAVLLDAENESFERQPTTFTGLPDLLDRFMMRLSAATGIPVSILMGRSAAGMNATGDNDFRAFYGDLENDRTNELSPKMTRFYHILACARDQFNDPDIEIEIDWPAMWSPTDKEAADAELATAQKDQIYATIGAVSPEIIAKSRWGQKGFNGTGMSAFDPAMADRDAADAAMMKNILAPPGTSPAQPVPGGPPTSPNPTTGGEPQNPAMSPPMGIVGGAPVLGALPA